MHLEWLDAMNLVNQTVASTNDFSQMYEKIVGIASQIFHALDAYIAELDAGGKQLKILAHSCHKGDCSSLIGSFTPPPNGLPSGKQIDAGETAFLTRDEIGVTTDSPFGEHIRDSSLQSMIIVPLRVREQVLGFLGLEMLETVNSISREENRLLHILSTDIAQIIQNAHFLEQSRLLIAVEERNRLARDLHDSVAQAFFGIRLYANAIQMARQNNRMDDLYNHVKEMNQLAQQGQANMRLLIFQLRPPLLDAGGLPVALQSRLNAVESRAGFKIEFEASETINLTPEQEIELYQIAQEILNNIIKHAQANNVKVHIADEGGYFRMMIADNGVGFEVGTADQAGGQGLRNLRERAKRIGATCTITSAPSQGTKISVEMNR
jgi:signal transduction histidine kinase